MKKPKNSLFKSLAPISLFFFVSDAFAQSSSCSSNTVGQVEGEMVKNMVNTMYDSVGQNLLEWVLFPIFAFCIILEFSKIVMGGWDKSKTIEWSAYIVVGGMLIGLIPSVNILPSEATRSGASSEILGSIDPDIGTQLYLLSNYMFRNATCEAFGGKEEQEKMVKEAADSVFTKISVAFSASTLCPEGRDQNKCFSDLLSLSNEDIKKKLKASCGEHKPGIETAMTSGNTIPYLYCRAGQVTPIIVTGAVVPILQWVQSALLYFFQLGFLVTLMFTLIFSKFSFATLPHEGSRANSVKMIKFLMAMGSFTFIVGFINLTTAVLLSSIDDAFTPFLIGGNLDFGQKVAKAMQMATLIFGAFATQIVFTMQIPKIITAIASGAMDEIGKIASEAMAVGTIGIASVIPYIGAGLSGSMRNNLTTPNGVSGEAPKIRGEAPFQDSSSGQTPAGGGDGSGGASSQPSSQPNSPAGAGFVNLEEEERKKNGSMRANINPNAAQFARNREMLKRMREGGETKGDSGNNNRSAGQIVKSLKGGSFKPTQNAIPKAPLLGYPKTTKSKNDSKMGQAITIKGGSFKPTQNAIPKAPFLTKPNPPKPDKSVWDKTKQGAREKIGKAWNGFDRKNKDGSKERVLGLRDVSKIAARKTLTGLGTAISGVGGATLSFAAGDMDGGMKRLKDFGGKVVSGSAEFTSDVVKTGGKLVSGGLGLATATVSPTASYAFGKAKAGASKKWNDFKNKEKVSLSRKEIDEKRLIDHEKRKAKEHSGRSTPPPSIW